jgi:hypothetical protein
VKGRIQVAASAGTAFDGRHLFRIAGNRIQKIDPGTGRVLATIPAPGGASGLTWAEGTLWAGRYREKARESQDGTPPQTRRPGGHNLGRLADFSLTTTS